MVAIGSEKFEELVNDETLQIIDSVTLVHAAIVSMDEGIFDDKEKGWLLHGCLSQLRTAFESVSRIRDQI